MTADLADVAVAFCRECLGWEDARTVYPNDKIYPGVYWSDSAKQDFTYTDLNAVMEAARGWCKDKLPDFYVLDITYYKPVPEVVDDLYIVTLRTNHHTHEAKSPDLRHALLAACVEAARKLRQ